MKRVSEYAERAALDNGIDNRKNLVDRYVCEECGIGKLREVAWNPGQGFPVWR